MKKIVAILFVYFLTATLPVAGADPPMYDVISISPPNIYSFATSLNNKGSVVGYGWNDNAFVVDKGKFYPLGEENHAENINDRDIVCGQYRDKQNYLKACFWLKGRWVFDTGPAETRYSIANAINNRGVIVGNAEQYDGPYGKIYPFVANGKSSQFLSSESGTARAINESGQIAGNVYPKNADPEDEFYWSSTALACTWKKQGKVYDQIDLPMPYGFFESYATGINNAGEVVGLAIAEDGWMQSTIWSCPDGTTYSVAFLPEVPGGGSTHATAINNSGQVVGEGPAGAVLWQNGTAYDLNTLVVDKSIDLFLATDINESGVIYCRGQNIKTRKTVAVLLTPVPK